MNIQPKFFGQFKTNYSAKPISYGLSDSLLTSLAFEKRRKLASLASRRFAKLWKLMEDWYKAGRLKVNSAYKVYLSPDKGFFFVKKN